MTDTVVPGFAPDAEEWSPGSGEIAEIEPEGRNGGSGTRWPASIKGLSVRKLAVLCVLAYIGLAIAAFLPANPLAAGELPIAGPHNPAGFDPFQMTWFLAWVPYALTHGQSLFHTTYFDYPTGVNLANNTEVPLLGILGWPITSALGPIATFNFLLRLSIALSGVSMFFVMRRWCRSTLAPFLAGLLYMFGPYMAAQKLHLDLAFVPLPPIMVLLIDDLVHRQRRSPYLIGALLGIVAACQYLISPDVLSGCVVMGIAAGIVLALLYRDEIRHRLPYVLRALPLALVTFALLGGYPIFEILAGPGHLRGPVVSERALSRVSSDLLGPVVPTSNQLAAPFISRLGNALSVGNLSENGSYLGIPLLVVLVSAFRRLRQDGAVRTFGWLALVAFVISLGPHLVIGSWTTPIPLPEAIFGHLPLLDNTIPVRYSLYTLLFASMIVGIAVDRLWLRPGAWMPSRSILPKAGARALSRMSPRNRVVLAGCVVAISVLPALPWRSRDLPWPSALPSTISNAVKPGNVVLVYPFTAPGDADAMAWQALGGMRFRLMGGYANIAVPGKTTGQRWPLLLAPASVQEVLASGEAGDPYPPPTSSPGTIEANLLEYLKRYSVGAVVASTDGTATDARTVSYLEQALGPPQLLEGNFMIWITPPSARLRATSQPSRSVLLVTHAPRPRSS